MLFDIIIKNGILLETETEGFTAKDMLIKDGMVFETVNPSLSEHYKAKTIIDANSCYVLPGLIDSHMHCASESSSIGVKADIYAPPNGITAVVDAGSVGTDKIDDFHSKSLAVSETESYAYLHILPEGIIDAKVAELHDPAKIDEALIRKTFEKYPDKLRGLKVRLAKSTLGQFGLKALDKAVKIAQRLESDGYHCKLDIHFSNLPEDVRLNDVLSIMRPGDILSHAFQTEGETIFDNDFRVRDDVREARKRGILFDSANARRFWSFDTAKAAVTQGFLPDIISSDTTSENLYSYPCGSLLYAMNVWSASGMKDADVIKAVTLTPARALGLSAQSSALMRGSAADVCVIETITHPSVTLTDYYGGTQPAATVFHPLLTVKSGRVIYRSINI